MWRLWAVLVMCGLALQGAEISGVVMDPTGAVISRASWELHGTAERTGRAGEDGRFQVRELPAGSYQIQISVLGFLPFSVQIEVQGGDVVMLPTITLEVGGSCRFLPNLLFRVADDSNSSVVWGTVSRMVEGSRLSAAGRPLRLEPGAIRVFSDQQGKFEFNVPPGKYTLWHGDYRQFEFNILPGFDVTLPDVVAGYVCETEACRSLPRRQTVTVCE